MAHELLGKTLGDPLLGEFGGEGVAERVKHQLAANFIQRLQACFADVALEAPIRVVVLRENEVILRLLALKAFEFFHQPGVKRDNGLFPVLGRSGANKAGLRP